MSDEVEKPEPTTLDVLSMNARVRDRLRELRRDDENRKLWRAVFEDPAGKRD